MTTAIAYEAKSDLLASITATCASANKARFEYCYDALGRRTSVVDMIREGIQPPEILVSLFV